MSSTDPPVLTPDSQPSLSSVWSWCCNGPVVDIQISCHGVVAVSTESTVHLYAGAPNFGVSQEINLAPACLTAYKFSAAGTDLITGASDGSIKWWEVPRGEETSCSQFPCLKGEEPGDENPAVSCIVAAKEGDYVAAAAGRTICIFTATGEHVHTIGPLAGTVLGLEWRKGGEVAANIGIAICIFSVDAMSFTPGPQYSADQAALTVLASAPNGKMLAAGCDNGSVRIWDLGSEAEGKISVHIKVFMRSPDATENVKCLAWDETGHFLATAGGSDVVVWDMEEDASEEGKDNSIVCYGHGRNAKITALKFQTNGNLLATGGDDCQVEVFDSSNFNSNGMVSGLVGSIVSVRVGHEAEGSSITALAWHPSGLILAGTNLGKVDAFEVAQPEPDNLASSLSGVDEKTFLIKRDVSNIPRQQQPNNSPADPHRRNNRHTVINRGWGGEPLLPSHRDDPAEKMFMPYNHRHQSKKTPARPMETRSRAPRVPHIVKDHRAKSMIHDYKNTRMPSRYYADQQQQAQQPPAHQQPPSQPSPHQQQATWPVMPPMMPWAPPYGPQMQYPQMQYGMPPGVPSSPLPPYNQSPVSQPSDVIRENTGPAGTSTNSMRSPAPSPQQPPGGQYSVSGYVPYHYRMPYPGPYAYYPMQPHMQMAEESNSSVPPQPPPAYTPDHHPRTNMNSSRSTTREFPRPVSSSDLNDDAASKTSEITNNGVNSMAPVTPSESSVSAYDHDGNRALQTLYIGNLAAGVDEHLLMQYFTSFGPIMNIQVIRDRDTRLSRGFAFVTYSHPMCAQMAMQHMDTMQLFGPFEGRRLKVSFSNRR